VPSCSFILSSHFPEPYGFDVAVDLIEFPKLLQNEKLVDAMVHVGFCENPTCRPTYRALEAFLSSNAFYPFEILRALVICREERGE
jgi:hypothetical protein